MGQLLWPSLPCATNHHMRRSHSRCHPSSRVLHCAPQSLQDVSSTEAAIIYTLEPVFGGALAYCLLGER